MIEVYLKLTMKGFQRWVLISCLLLGAQACEPEEINPSSDNADHSGEIIDTSIFGGEWILIDYKNAWLPTDLRYKASLKFNRSQGDIHIATGISFVNQYSGGCKLDEEHGLLSVDNIISTKMGGTPDENAAEENYFKNLMSVKSYELAGDYLTLYFDNKEVGYFVRKK